MFALPKTVTVLVVAVLIAGPAAAQAPLPFDYNFEEEARLADRLDVDNPDPDTLRDVFERRRARVLSAIPAGAMLIYSVERAQERRLEFQVPHSDNHDFIYLTGLDGIDSLDSALLLLPAANDARGRLDEPVRDWVVLYTSGNPEKISARTGIEDVRPFDVLENDLSVAMTDFRDWRITAPGSCACPVPLAAGSRAVTGLGRRRQGPVPELSALLPPRHARANSARGISAHPAVLAGDPRARLRGHSRQGANVAGLMVDCESAARGRYHA